MRLIFFGTSEFAVPALHALIKYDRAPDLVVTATDKPKNRGKQLTAPPIKQWLKIDKPSLSILQPDKIDTAIIALIAAHKPDIGIVAAYGKILPKKLISIFPKGILNIHPSLLPKYRGPSPIQAAILNGDTETGVTIMLIDEKMDHGLILTRHKFPIVNTITHQELHDQLARLGAQMLVEVLPQWLAGKIMPVAQDDTKATYTKLLKKEDGKIDWTKPAEEIERMVRAYNPWPGTYTTIKGGKILKIKKAEILIGDFRAVSGTFFKTSDGFPTVVCSKNALKLLVIQPESRQNISGQEFLRRHPQIFENEI